MTGYHSGKRRLVNRLRSLRTLEAFNVVWVPASLAYLWRTMGAEGWLLRSGAVAIVAYILVQGAIYWQMKLNAVIRGERGLPGYFPALFNFFRRSNLWLFIAYGILVAVVIARGALDSRDLAWGIGLYGFAILEHVNYYAYQLMHDSRNDRRYLARHRRLRRAALRDDLDAALSAG